VIIALLGFLPNQFKEPPEVSAEFGEGYAAPAEGAERTVGERFAQRILTDKNLDVGFSLNQEEAGHRLRGLWRRMRQEEHERQPPYERPGLRRPPLPDPSTWAVSEELLDEQGLEPIELEGVALGEYLADLEEAVRVWWRTTGPATSLPAHQGRLVDPEGPETGGRWPSDNFLTAQIRTLWALERAERTFATGVDVSERARAWLTGQRAAHFTSLHEPSQRAPDDRGRCVRYVSLDQPVDPTPKPPERGTHLVRSDDMAIVSELPHLQPEELREMELVLRAYLQAAAREPDGQERFKGPLPIPFQALGFQAEELAGRIARWERMESNQSRPRGIVNGAIVHRDQWWKTAFTDFNLDPPKPRTELVTRQGNRVYVVKWTPELPRPEPTEEAEEQPSSSTGGGPQLIYTRETSPSMRPLRTSPPDTS
ncbi:MAG TPA: hypothetical protein VJR06_06155, partial [Nitrososphaerales archaeon]|nr:hypothetical protein [Nitrososphaerales archaeon]